MLVLIFISACSVKEKIDDSKFEGTNGDVYVTYENGILSYEVFVQKPTPCHKIIKDERVMESYPVQVTVDLTLESSDEICIQVISEEKIEGTINIGHKPGSFTVRLNDEIIHSTNLKNKLCSNINTLVECEFRTDCYASSGPSYCSDTFCTEDIVLYNCSQKNL